MFDKHRNKDGSIDGVAALGELTGLGTAEVAKIAGEVKANRARLESCSWHDFEPIPGCRPLRQRYRCVHCAGEIDCNAYVWFTEGRAQRK